jgi:hypothetical protein
MKVRVSDVKVSALPSPKRLPAAQGFGRRGSAQAGLKLSHPSVCSVSRISGAYSDYDNGLRGGEGVV